MNVLLFTIPALLALSPVALAAEPEAPPSVETTPDGGGFLQSPQVVPSPVTGDSVEPDITIRAEGDQLIYEYRVNGQLYMIRIQPQFGPPYFLIDTDGDGIMDIRNNSPRDISIPQWVLFSWD
jgi:hypothetical protein